MYKSRKYKITDLICYIFFPGGHEKFKPGHDTQMAEKEKFLGHQPDNQEAKVPLPRLSLENNRLINDVNSNHTETNLVRTQSVGSRPERPPKPDHMKSLERIDIEPPNNNTSQRTMSHEDIVDIDSELLQSPKSPVQAPLSPRGHGRLPPQRPQPPPPPPPVRPKSEGESTDL